MELLPLKLKAELGNMLLELLPKKKLAAMRGAMLWTIGRLGTRVPLYGPFNTVIAPEVAGRWIETLLGAADKVDALQTDAMFHFASCSFPVARATAIATSPTTCRRQVLLRLEAAGSPHQTDLVRDGGRLDSEEAGRIFGESLPKGLRLR